MTSMTIRRTTCALLAVFLLSACTGGGKASVRRPVGAMPVLDAEAEAARARIAEVVEGQIVVGRTVEAGVRLVS